MNKSQLIGALIATVLSLISLSSHAALISRLGGQAAYDDVLGITWTNNADIAGKMSWDDANTWASNFVLGGAGWRLPGADVNGDELVIICDAFTESECRDNELDYI